MRWSLNSPTTVVARLVEKEAAGTVPIERAQHEINHALKAQKNEERLEELLAKWRGEYNIEVFDKTVKKVKIEPRRASRQ